MSFGFNFRLSPVRGRGLNKYRPYINYTWQMLPNGQVQNNGTSSNLQLYSGNPLDFQGNQEIVVDLPNDTTTKRTYAFACTPNATYSTSNYAFSVDGLFCLLSVGTNGVMLYGKDENGDTYTHTYNFPSVKSYLTGILQIKSGDIQVIIDGETILDLTQSLQVVSYSFTIGSRRYVASAFDGQFDYMCVSDRVLTTEEIALSNSNPNEFYEAMKNDANTLFATDFRGLGSTIKDSISGTEYTITNYSETMRTNFQQEPTGLQDLTRSFDNLGFYTGVTDYLNCNGKGYGDTGWVPSADEDWSIEFSFYNDGINEYQFNGNTKTYIGRHVNSNQLRISILNNLSYIKAPIGNVNVIVRYYNNNFHEIFINKITQYSSVGLALTFISETLPFYLGRRSDTFSYMFKNQITKFKVHPKALTDEEIQAL